MSFYMEVELLSFWGGATLQNVLSLTRDCQPQCGPDSLLWIWLRFLKENYDKQKRIYCWEYSIYVKGILCKKNYFALIRVWCNFKQCRHVSAQSIFMQDPKRSMRNGTPASLTLRVAPAWSCLAAMNTIIALATIARRCNSKEHTILISMYHCTTLERCSISDRIPSSPT